MSATEDEFLYIGDVLRDALVSDISVISWEGVQKERAAKVKSALQLAAPHRGGFLVDVHDWTWEDEDFLRDTLRSVVEDEGHSFMSHGVALGSTRIGRQIQALRKKL
jgi:hypothetical protein